MVHIRVILNSFVNWAEISPCLVKRKTAQLKTWKKDSNRQPECALLIPWIATAEPQ